MHKMKYTKGEAKKELLERLGIKQKDLVKVTFTKPKSDKGI